jgi:ferrochelatase
VVAFYGDARLTLPYDAFILVSFGGPEGPDDVLPFLENVLRGRNVPRERMLEVAEHYQHFGGVSPINAQNRALIAALEQEFRDTGLKLPIYFGNRNWHPLMADTLRQMAADGVRRALAFVTSAYSSYSGCRQYRENIEAARQIVGPEAPTVDKLRVFYNHPGFVDPMVELVRDSLATIPAARRATTQLLFTAHSIPQAMSDNCNYVKQLTEAARLVASQTSDLGVAADRWQLVYQSRSGPPTQPWLEPDVGDALRAALASGATDAIVIPIGFISDHMEVMFDLDVEAHELCQEMGLNMIRCPTVGTHPRFVRMIAELVKERMSKQPERLALGQYGPNHDVCPVDCCRYEPQRPGMGGPGGRPGMAAPNTSGPGTGGPGTGGPGTGGPGTGGPGTGGPGTGGPGTGGPGTGGPGGRPTGPRP